MPGSTGNKGPRLARLSDSESEDGEPASAAKKLLPQLESVQGTPAARQFQWFFEKCTVSHLSLVKLCHMGDRCQKVVRQATYTAASHTEQQLRLRVVQQFVRFDVMMSECTKHSGAQGKGSMGTAITRDNMLEWTVQLQVYLQGKPTKSQIAQAIVNRSPA
ncbi:MAG: hypothetical protein WDW38_008756 [Sanguina aurantia]